MAARSDFWGGVAFDRGTAQARRDWVTACGRDFAVFAKRYLVGTGNPVSGLVCGLRCGCVHRRTRSERELVTYACDCDEQDCPSVTIPIKDAEGVEFVGRQFYQALAGALGIDRGRVAYAGQVGTIHLGHVNVVDKETWVFLVCVAGAGEQCDAVSALLQKYSHRPIAVLMPDYTADVGVLVERNGGAVVELRGYVKLVADGSLVADRPLAERLGRTGKGVQAKAVDVPVGGRYAVVAKGKYVRKGEGEQREFKRWGVTFDGHEYLLPETDGAQYIAFLITHPDIPFSPKDLFDVVRGEHPAGQKIDGYADWIFSSEGEEGAEMVAQVRKTANARDVVWDARQIMEAEIRLRALSKMAESLTESSPGEAEELRGRMADEAALLNANTKQIRGGKRVPLDYVVNEYTALSGIIRKAVVACLKQVDLNLPAFGKHLRDKTVFTCGMVNEYRRPKNMEWVCLK